MTKLQIFRALRDLGGELQPTGWFTFRNADETLAALSLVEEKFPSSTFETQYGRQIRVVN